MSMFFMIPLISIFNIVIPVVFIIAFAKLYKRIKHWSCIILIIPMLMYITNFLYRNIRFWRKSPDEFYDYLNSVMPESSI